MTDPIERLEEELRSLRPREMSRELADRIESQISRSIAWSFSDRCLVGAMCSGAIAACVMIAIVLTQSRPSPGVAPQATASVNVPTVGPFSIALARADVDFPEKP